MLGEARELAAPSILSERAPRERGRLRAAAAFLRANPLGTICAVVLVLITLVAIFAPRLAPYSPTSTHLTEQLQSPNGRHLLGTDNLGRDLLSRIIYGARISMTVGFVSMVVSGTVALLLGVTGAFFRGPWDYAVSRVVEVVQALPGIILLLALVAIAGRSVLSIGLVLGLLAGIVGSRVVRATTLTITAQPFVEVARGVGAGPLRLMLRHILPNLFPIAIVLGTINVGFAILAEAGLSFLGYGVAPPAASWGGLISIQGRTYMVLAPWLFYAPVLTLMVVIFSCNMLGDTLRDRLDPRLRGSG